MAVQEIVSEGLALSLASSLSRHRLWLVVCYLQLDCLLVGSSIYTVSVGAYSQYITTYLTTHHLRSYCAQSGIRHRSVLSQDHMRHTTGL